MFIPTMKSTYAAAAVITFMNAWNSYLWPKVIMTDNKAMTMPMLIANLITGYVTDYGMLMCGVLFCSIPTMIVFFVLQKQLNKKLKKKNITSTVWKTLLIIYTERAKENTRQIMKSNFAGCF